MYDERDLSRALGMVARRSWIVKIGVVVALVGLVSLLMLAPFGTSDDQVSAACPAGTGLTDEDPVVPGALRAQQVAFAKIIDDVAVRRGLPGQATLVALMTALQESQLQNLTGGDRDSVGLFQQRPSTGWGPAYRILNPTYATEAFFGGSNPPSPPGLVDIDGWPSMSYNDAAQAVQRSGYPFAYAKQEKAARSIAAQAGINLSRPGDPYAGRAGAKPAGDEEAITPQDADDCGGGLISGKPINGVWPPEDASVTDPSGTGGLVTPRMAAWVSQAETALGSLSLGCWDAHAWNPTSDHPKGRACDVFVGTDARQSAPARIKGDRIANWAVQTAAQTGVHYVIWYGKIWSARTGQWKVYNGAGIYDTTSATGGHYDHVHVSVY
ncbi:hypothetical protein OHA10_24465 [Kribbella sp. NBC_00662]|uniref:hypothetical protein n=1 Tax=Kribbella sp. NBC_00662 TaxID=2975969 RepID=UPI0032547072